jgi:ubiquinone/menaquinone biosynthesis C-methylase UbiE
VRFFERPWLTNLILWGQYKKLTEAAIRVLSDKMNHPGNTLQVACVYGDLTLQLARQQSPVHSLSVIDVLPIQLENLKTKCQQSRIGTLPALIECDSQTLAIESGSQNQVLLFFLLHEQPEDVRRATLSEAIRVLKPSGQLVIVDYRAPSRWHPCYWIMKPILKCLEPDALDLWDRPVEHFLPHQNSLSKVQETHLFGALYQIVILEKPPEKTA